MMHNTKTSIFGLGLFFSSVYGHMLLKNPVPFGEPDNSPLAADGSNFPCKIPSGGSYQVSKMNDWQVGSQQTLEFSGSAVHGGGSCQIAVTTDKQPSKASKWKVIYSIEGGCPGVDGPQPFPFTVPEELPNGEATMAWTWFNHIGNREMYMFCAPVKISGGSDDTSAFDGLPDMAVANIGEASPNCKTTESNDYTFKDPGKYKTRIGAGPFVELCGGAASPGTGSPAPPAGGVPGGQPQPPANNGLYTPPASQAPPAAPTAPAVPPPGPQTSTIRTLITVTAPAGTAPPAQPSQPPSNNETVNLPSLAPSAPAAQPSQAPPAGGSGGCGTTGGIVCNGPNQFGICDNGKVVWQPVAPGTTCQNGAIAKRHIVHRALRNRAH